MTAALISKPEFFQLYNIHLAQESKEKKYIYVY